MVLKLLKIIPPWYVLLDYFTTRPSFKNLYDAFFDQVARDAKNVKTFEKRPLVPELKMKTS